MTQTLCHSEVYDSFTYRKGDYSRIYLLFKLLIRIWLVGCLGLSNYSSYYSNSHLLLLVPSNSHLLLFLSNSHWLLFLSNSHLLLFVSFRLLVSLFCVSQCVSLSLLYACESFSTLCVWVSLYTMIERAGGARRLSCCRYNSMRVYIHTGGHQNVLYTSFRLCIQVACL